MQPAVERQKTPQKQRKRPPERQVPAFFRAAVSRRKLAAPRQQVKVRSVAGRALDWLFPWESAGYPGVVRGIVELLGKRVTWAAFKHWRRGRRALPKWVADALADHIEAKARIGLEIVAELRAYTPPERKATGFLVIDPVTKTRSGALGR